MPAFYRPLSSSWRRGVMSLPNNKRGAGHRLNGSQLQSHIIICTWDAVYTWDTHSESEISFFRAWKNEDAVRGYVRSGDGKSHTKEIHCHLLLRG